VTSVSCVNLVQFLWKDHFISLSVAVWSFFLTGGVRSDNLFVSFMCTPRAAVLCWSSPDSILLLARALVSAKSEDRALYLLVCFCFGLLVPRLFIPKAGSAVLIFLCGNCESLFQI
jgi:hypothetical protein